jgi:hypothetical protein
MKIIAFDRFKPGVTLDDLRPYLREEVSNAGGCGRRGSYAKTTRVQTSVES